MEGKLHIYHQQRGLLLFEYGSPSAASQSESEATGITSNVILFIGGMYDNFGSVSYVSDLAALFPRHEGQQWTVVHVQLSSAMRQFGISDLNRDVEEIATAITFIRQQLRNNQLTNIVLMGHSTGCQDTLHYLHSPTKSTGSSEMPSSKSSLHIRPTVQGAILQAAVSDRDMTLHTINTDTTIKLLYEKCRDMISKTPKEEHRKTILPLHWTTPMFSPAPLTITRFLSLVSPTSPEEPGDDDKFSHDLPPEALAKTFGAIATNGILQPALSLPPPPPQQHSQSPSEFSPQNPNKKSILILLSDNDEFYPPNLATDKSEFLQRWKSALENPPPFSSSSFSSSSQSASEKAILHPSSQVIPHGQHDLSGSSIDEQIARLVYMRRAVLTYLQDTVGGVDEVAWKGLEADQKRLLQDSSTVLVNDDLVGGGEKRLGDNKL